MKTIIAVEAGTGNWPDYTAWRDTAAALPPNVEVSAQDDVLQLYTSGTTGRPKGVMLAGRNLMNLRILWIRLEKSGLHGQQAM